MLLGRTLEYGTTGPPNGGNEPRVVVVQRRVGSICMLCGPFVGPFASACHDSNTPRIELDLPTSGRRLPNEPICHLVPHGGSGNNNIEQGLPDKN